MIQTPTNNKLFSSNDKHTVDQTTHVKTDVKLSF